MIGSSHGPARQAARESTQQKGPRKGYSQREERTVATRAALGSGPIGFTDPTTGTQVLIPLSALSFDAGGNLKPAQSYSQAAQDWLQYLADQGEITPAPSAPP